MAYRCPECGEIFDEPNYVEGYWEDYNGVSSLFESRTRYVFAECPHCGGPINTEEDVFDEDEVNEDDDRFAYYERQGDEYVYYDNNECEIYREPA